MRFRILTPFTASQEGGVSAYERSSKMPTHRNKTLVQAFNLVPILEQVLSDRPKTEVSGEET